MNHIEAVTVITLLSISDEGKRLSAFAVQFPEYAELARTLSEDHATELGHAAELADEEPRS